MRRGCPDGGRRGYTCRQGPGRRTEDAIYTLPVIVIAFAFILLFAILTELPLWMVGLALVLALLGYFLERKRPPASGPGA